MSGIIIVCTLVMVFHVIKDRKKQRRMRSGGQGEDVVELEDRK